MSLKERIKSIENRINNKTSEITKEQILSHNIERFKAHFNDGEGDIFVYPHECVKPAEDGKKRGYVYRGVYQGANLLGVKIYESENVNIELNEFRDAKVLKNKSGKDLFSLDELAEFDYNNTQKVWRNEMFHTSLNKNKLQATKEVIGELIHRRLDDSRKM